MCFSVKKGVRKVSVFVAIFHSVYFFQRVVKLRLFCGELCMFLLSVFFFFFINVPL